MSKNGKIDYPDGNDDREDIQRFENYDKCSNTKHLETLKNEDILNYIKDFEQNCRLEASSNDEDCAGVEKSSNRSARCSGTRFKSFKKPLSLKTTSRKNKNIALERKAKSSSDHNAMKACNDCCSARKYHFRGNPDLTDRKNSRKDLNTSPKFSHQRPYLSGNSYKYRASSPTFYGWYSRKDHKTRPTVTEMGSLEVIKDRSQNAICDFRNNNKSKITSRNSAKVRTSKSLRRRKFSDSTYTGIHSITAPNEKTTERDPRYRIRKQREETWMRKLNEESDVSEYFVDQQPLNKIYSDQDIAFSYQSPSQNGGYKGYYTKEYPVKRYRQPISWGLRSRSNRLTASTRLPETSSLLQGRTSQRENEIRPPLKAPTSIMEASIDKNYRRETKRKNNTDQRRRKPDVLGERESSCYCRPGLLRESGKLCKVVRTEDKQQLGYCREDTERDETLDCSRYCRCSENLNDFTRPQFKSTRPPIARSKRANYTATLRRVSPESVRSRDNDEGESEINLSMEEDSQNEDAVYHNHSCDVFDDVRTNTYDGAVHLEYLKPRVSFPDDRAYRRSSQVAREYKKLSNDLKSIQGETMGAPTASPKTITAKYPAGKKFSFAIRTPEKSVSGDSLGLRYDVAEFTCECEGPFDHPSAAFPTGFCTCIGNDENAETNDSDSPRSISDTVHCCWSCLPVTSRNEKDPVKKLESFCERVKAINQDKLSKYICRNVTNAKVQEYTHDKSDEQNQSKSSTQRAIRREKLSKRERLEDPARLRLEKPKHSHDRANLEKILIYPPRGEGGPPLTLYKRASNISCRVKGDVDTGFRYNVTYVQKFVSPAWMPSLTLEIPPRNTNEGCGCSADYG